MAKRIRLQHPASGLIKEGFYGFSWTILFCGFFPALFRVDFLTVVGGFAISVIVAVVTFGFGAFVLSIAWAFMYNKYYTRKLIQAGYRIADTPERTMQARQALGVAIGSGEAAGAG